MFMYCFQGKRCTRSIEQASNLALFAAHHKESAFRIRWYMIPALIRQSGRRKLAVILTGFSLKGESNKDTLDPNMIGIAYPGAA